MMICRSLCALLVFGHVFVSAAVAENARAASGVSGTQPTQLIETKLAAPANLPPISKITFAELIEKLNDEHQISVTVNRNFALVFGTIFNELMVSNEWRPQQFAARKQTTSNSLLTTATSPSMSCPPGVICQVVPQPQSYAAPPTYESSPLPPQYTASPVVPINQDSPAPAVISPVQPENVITYKPEQQEEVKKKLNKKKLSAANDESNQKNKNEEPSKEQNSDEEAETDATANIHLITKLTETFMKTEVSLEGFDTQNISVANLLRHAISQIVNPMDMVGMEELGLPVPMSHAYELDLLVLDGTVQITTRMHANLFKETRIYNVSQFKDISSEDLSRVISKSIRPWSWRSQVNELIGQVTAQWPSKLKFPEVAIDLTGNDIPVRLKPTAVVSTEDGSEPKLTSEKNQELSLEALNALGSLMSTGTIAFVHSVISGTEMIHYAEPPTGVIETLPGLLIITQSQSAHREIAALLNQLHGQIAN